jgi:hypothetical protein
VEAIKKADEPKAEAHREEPKGDVNVKDSVLVDTTIGGEKHDDDEKLAFEEMKDIAEQNRQERAETGRLPSAGELAIEKMAETGRELTDQEAIQAAAEAGRLEREKTGRPPSIKDKALEMLAKSEDGELSNEDAMKLIKEKRREKEAEEEKKPKKKRRTFADGFTDAGKKGDN